MARLALQSSVSACSTTGSSRCSKACGAASGVASVCPDEPLRNADFDPDGVIEPGRTRRPLRTARRQAPEHVVVGQPIALQPAAKQPEVTVGGRAGPCGDSRRGQFRIARLTGRRLEIIGQEFVDRGGARDQTLEERFHNSVSGVPRTLIPRGMANVTMRGDIRIALFLPSDGAASSDEREKRAISRARSDRLSKTAFSGYGDGQGNDMNH